MLGVVRSMGKPPSKAGKYDPKFLAELLKENEAILAECNKEPYGTNTRGRDTMLRIMNDAAKRLGKKKTKRRQAAQEVSRLIFQSHALRNGAMKLKELNKRDFTRTFLGYDYVKEIPFRHGQIILLELFRHGRSDRLDHYQKLQAEYLERKRKNFEKKISMENMEHKAEEAILAKKNTKIATMEQPMPDRQPSDVPKKFTSWRDFVPQLQSFNGVDDNKDQTPNTNKCIGR
jgi:hypothetical protein